MGKFVSFMYNGKLRIGRVESLQSAKNGRQYYVIKVCENASQALITKSFHADKIEWVKDEK